MNNNYNTACLVFTLKCRKVKVQIVVCDLYLTLHAALVLHIQKVAQLNIGVNLLKETVKIYIIQIPAF